MPPARLIEHFLSSHLHPEAGILRPAESEPPPAICLAVVPMKLNMLYFLPFTSTWCLLEHRSCSLGKLLSASFEDLWFDVTHYKENRSEDQCFYTYTPPAPQELLGRGNWQYRLGFYIGIFLRPAEGPLTLSYSSSPAVAAHTTGSQCQDLAQFTCKSLRLTLLPVLGSGRRERERSHFSFELFWTLDDRCSAVRRVLQHESTQAQMPVTAGVGRRALTHSRPARWPCCILSSSDTTWTPFRCLLVTCFCHEHVKKLTGNNSMWKQKKAHSMGFVSTPQSKHLELPQHKDTFYQTSGRSTG